MGDRVGLKNEMGRGKEIDDSWSMGVKVVGLSDEMDGARNDRRLGGGFSEGLWAGNPNSQ
jgi:hypothetical protein